jgi:hypothetical protein
MNVQVRIARPGLLVGIVDTPQAQSAANEFGLASWARGVILGAGPDWVRVDFHPHTITPVLFTKAEAEHILYVYEKRQRLNQSPVPGRWGGTIPRRRVRVEVEHDYALKVGRR